MRSKSFDIKSFIIIWLLNPFLSAIILLRQFASRPPITPFLFLSFFFGISFVISPTSNADSVRYAEELKMVYKNPTTLSSYMKNIYTEESTKLDWYQPLITWIIGQFTDNYKWLFCFFAIIFGYFWFSSLLLLMQLIPSKLTSLIIFSLTLLALTNPIWNINGVRMWTAVQMFFYGLLVLNVNNNKKGYFFLIFSLFVHFSLSLAFAVFILFNLLPKKKITLLFIFFIFSFFLIEIDLGQIRYYFDQLPGFLQSRKSYLNEDYALSIGEEVTKSSLHILVYLWVLKYLILALCVWMFFFYSKFKISLSSQWIQLFAISLFYGTFSNIASKVPSGGRFVTLSNLLIISSFIWALVLAKNSFNRLLKFLLIISMTIVLLVQVRMSLDFTGLSFFLGNPIINLFINDTLPLIDFIKSIFQ